MYPQKPCPVYWIQVSTILLDLAHMLTPTNKLSKEIGSGYFQTKFEAYPARIQT